MDGGNNLNSQSPVDSNNSHSTVSDSTPLNGTACNGQVNAAFEDTEATTTPTPTTPTKDSDQSKANGEFKSPTSQDGSTKVAEAVNLELVTMSPYSNSIPVKKESTELDMTDPYDEYFVPVNQHKKYIRGEKLYVTQDKRENLQGGKKKCCCGVITVIVLGAIVAILVGVLLTQDTMSPPESEARNYNKAGFNNLIPTPPPQSKPSMPPQTTDMSHIYLKNVIEGEMTIENLNFSPALEEKENDNYKSLADSLESEIKKALFDYQTLNNGAADIYVKVENFRQGSVIVTYRIGWRFKEGIRGAHDPINVETLKTKFEEYLRHNNGFLHDYKISMDSIKSNNVIDSCQMDNNGCSHGCYYNHTHLTVMCSCPPGYSLAKDEKTCSLTYAEDDHLDDHSHHHGHHHQHSEEEEGKTDSREPEESQDHSNHFHHEEHHTPTTSEEPFYSHNGYEVHEHQETPTEASHSEHDHHEHEYNPIQGGYSTEMPMIHEHTSEESSEMDHHMPDDHFSHSVETSQHHPTEQPVEQSDHSIDHSYKPSSEETFHHGYEVIEPEGAYEHSTEPPHDDSHHMHEMDHHGVGGISEESSTEPPQLSSEHEPSVTPISEVPMSSSQAASNLSSEIGITQKPEVSEKEKMSISEEHLDNVKMEFLPEYSTLSDSAENQESATQPIPSLSAIPTQSAENNEKELAESTAEEMTTKKNSEEDAETLSENDTISHSFSNDNATHLEINTSHSLMENEEHNSNISLSQGSKNSNNFVSKESLNVSEVMNHLPQNEFQITEVSTESSAKSAGNPGNMIFVTLPPPQDRPLDNSNGLETFREAKAANLTNTTTTENPPLMPVDTNQSDGSIDFVSEMKEMGQQKNVSESSLIPIESGSVETVPVTTLAPSSGEDKPVIIEILKHPDSMSPENAVTESHNVQIATLPPAQLNDTEIKMNSEVESTSPSLGVMDDKNEKPEMDMPDHSMHSHDHINLDDLPPMITVTKIPDLDGPFPVVEQSNEERNDNGMKEETDSQKLNPVNIDKLLKESSSSLNSLEDDYDNFKPGQSKLIKDFNVKEVFSPPQNNTESEVVKVNEESSPKVEIPTTASPLFSDNAYTTINPLFESKPDQKQSTEKPKEVSSSSTAADPSKDPMFSEDAFTTISPLFMHSSVETTIKSIPENPPTTPLIINLLTDRMDEDKMTTMLPDTSSGDEALLKEYPHDNMTSGMEVHMMGDMSTSGKPEEKLEVTTEKRDSLPVTTLKPAMEDSDGQDHSVSKKEMETDKDMASEYPTEAPVEQASKEISENAEKLEPGMMPMVEDPIVKLLYNNSYPNTTLQFKCPSGQTTCKDGNGCISPHQLCDSEKNCKDGSDEEDCENRQCLENFQCSDGKCLKRNLVCDGFEHCQDGSDERNCSDWKCKFDEVQCLPMSRQCIPALWKCDGVSNCPGHVDEIGCKDSCENEEFFCPEGYCISMEKKCDGTKDCTNGEDELNC